MMDMGGAPRTRPACPVRAGFGLGLIALLAQLFAGPGVSPLRAQSVFGGEVEGRVVDQRGLSIRGASVTLTEVGSSAGRSMRTRDNGVFSFFHAPGGAYDLRVEALGYRPMLVRGVAVVPGDQVHVPVVLVAEPPPVNSQDTVLWAVSGLATPTLGRAVGGVELAALPDRLRDLTGVMALSSWADPFGGLEGLPAGFSTMFSEGLPVRTASHPGLRGTGAPLGLFLPRVGLQSATILTGLEDIEWSGVTGGLVSLNTATAASGAPGELFGFWSGGPTWSNEVVGEGPAMLSVLGGGSVSFPIAEAASPLTLHVEGGVLETPNLFWRSDYFTDDLVPGSHPPGTRTTGFGAASARVDFRVPGNGRATVRASFSTFRNQSDRFGTPLGGYASELPGEGTDGSVATVVAVPISESMMLEVKGAGGLSYRSWEADAGALPGAFLVGDRTLVGTNPYYPATSDRLDFSFSPVLHYHSGVNRMKGGIKIELGFFDLSHIDEAPGAFFFGSPAAMTAGQGAAISLPGAIPSSAFQTRRFTAFGQYRWLPLAGLHITSGISWSREDLPMEEITFNEAWSDLTEISNVSNDNQLSSLNGRVNLRWDLKADGKSWLLAGMGMEHGPLEVAAMHEVLTLDGTAPVDRVLGGGLNWANGTVQGPNVARGSRLAMFGRDLAPPRTSRASVGLFRNLPGGFRIGVSGSFRRTESLLRRTDLNRLLEPVGTDQNGRPLYGDLRIVSGVLGADPLSNRRFPTFESVWALDADGWSEYAGLTGIFEAPLGVAGSINVQYTLSRTRDNWLGASKDGSLARLDPGIPEERWDESISDFDIPHRLSALWILPIPALGDSYLSGLYTLRSDQPFTPRVATGLDANGDGSPFNDVAFVPATGSEIQALASEWGCIADALGSFPERNGCRGDPIHTLDVRLSLGLPAIGGLSSAIVVDGLNLTDNDMGIRDDNLLLLGGGSVTNNGGTYHVPYKVNPGFGGWVFRGDTGRMLRVGLRIGGGQ